MRCVTLNTWKNDGNYQARLTAMAEGLAALGADVIALQECFFAETIAADTAEALARALGMQVTRQAMRSKLRWHDGVCLPSRSDLALLTREAPLARGYAEFPGDPRDEDRGLLWIELAAGSAAIRFGCTHLTHFRDAAGEAVRKEQANAALECLLKEWRGPAVLMGDLNARADQSSLAPIFANPALDPAARSAAIASGEVDHVLLLQGGDNCQFIAHEVTMRPDRANLDAGPSDHPAVVMDFHVLEVPDA